MKSIRSLIALVVIALLAAPLGAVEIVPPEVGATEVEVTGLSVPTPPGGPDKGGAISLESKGWLLFLHYRPSAPLGYVLDVLNMLVNVPAFGVLVRTAIAQLDVVVAIDMWAQTFDLYSMGGKALPPVPEIVGFEAGSTQLTINGLPEGAEIHMVSALPGSYPSTRIVWEGGGGDLDQAANGVLVIAPPRADGPPYVLPGETLVVAVIDEPGGLAVVQASGEPVRHVVPAASHIIGASGVPFISDLALSNPFGLPVDGWLRFVAEGSRLENAPSVDFHLDPGQSTSWTDVLQSAFGIDGNVKGTLLLGGYPHWLLQATSRNYAVDAQGRQFGLAVPAVPTTKTIAGASPWIIPGLRHGNGFRANLVMAGAVPQPSTVTIRLFSEGELVGEATREVPAYGLLQLNRVAEVLGAGTIDDGYVELKVTGGAIVAGLSVVDGSADDAAYIPAEPLLR